MHINEEEELKKEFQLERVILFTDAVFAIILTIMVLDVKLPEGIREFTRESQMTHAFKELFLKFLAYLITFALVAKFWMTHLKLFRYLKDYDTTLIILNLVFLFCASLFPFAVSLISGNIDPKFPEFEWAFAVYVFVIYATIYVQALICRYLIKNRETLCINTPNLEVTFKWKIQRINLFVVPLMFLIILILIYTGLPYTYIIFSTAAYGAITGRLSKKYYPETNKGPLIMQLFSYVKAKRTKKHIAIKSSVKK